MYDFEIMIWNHVSDLGKSNTPHVGLKITLTALGCHGQGITGWSKNNF